MAISYFCEFPLAGNSRNSKTWGQLIDKNEENVVTVEVRACQSTLAPPPSLPCPAVGRDDGRTAMTKLGGSKTWYTP